METNRAFTFLGGRKQMNPVIENEQDYSARASQNNQSAPILPLSKPNYAQTEHAPIPKPINNLEIDPTSISEGDIPPYFRCPISGAIMLDPCTTLCGHMFDRNSLFPNSHSISTNFKNSTAENNNQHKILKQPEILCPLCGQIIFEFQLIPCHAIKLAIIERFGCPAETLEPTNGRRPSSAPQTRETVVSMLLRSWKKRSSAKKNKKPQAIIAPRRTAEPQTCERRGASSRAPSAISQPPFQIATTVMNSATVVNLLADEYVPDAPAGPVWARLVPLMDDVTPLFSVNRDKYIGGRNPCCHAHISLAEISSRHFCIWRIQGDDGKFEVFLEDISTNGTFVNGVAIGRGNRKQIYHGCEITLGRKFTTRRGLPNIPFFIKWLLFCNPVCNIFLPEIELLTKLPSFWNLLRADESTLEQIGIKTPALQVLILEGREAWAAEHKFPAFFLDLVGPETFAEPPSLPPVSTIQSTPAVGATISYTARSLNFEDNLFNHPMAKKIPCLGEPASGALAVTGLEDMVARMSVSPSIILALQARFPGLEKDFIGLVASYEMVLGATGDLLLERCSNKIREYMAASPGSTILRHEENPVRENHPKENHNDNLKSTFDNSEMVKSFKKLDDDDTQHFSQPAANQEKDDKIDNKSNLFKNKEVTTAVGAE